MTYTQVTSAQVSGITETNMPRVSQKGEVECLPGLERPLWTLNYPSLTVGRKGSVLNDSSAIASENTKTVEIIKGPGMTEG